MKKGDFLFVYGTLRLGQSADLTRTGGALFAGPDRVSGRLYALGWLPGVKLDGETFDDAKPAVTGECFLIEDESITARLDHYEGHPHLFCRKVVKTESGRDAWVYEYMGSTDYAASPVESGDWLTGEH